MLLRATGLGNILSRLQCILPVFFRQSQWIQPFTAISPPNGDHPSGSSGVTDVEAICLGQGKCRGSKLVQSKGVWLVKSDVCPETQKNSNIIL